MYANKSLLLIGVSVLILSSCSFNNNLDGIWVSSDNKSLLEINEDNWKIIYSEVSGLCTQMKITEDQGDTGLLELISPKNMDIEEPIRYQIMKSEIAVLGKKYSSEIIPQWDSILVYKSDNARKKMTVVNRYVFDSSTDHDLLVTLVMVPQFDLIHPSNTATDYLIKYELWYDNKVINSKIGGSNFLCVSH